MDGYTGVSDVYKGASNLLQSGEKAISLKYTLNSGTSMPIIGCKFYYVSLNRISIRLYSCQ